MRCAAEPLPTASPWHRHDGYELHLLIGASGLAFVGDWIGTFESGQVVLTGPHLPHGWLPLDSSVDQQRHHVIRFDHEPLTDAARGIPELIDLSPLFERARQGVEFFGWEHRAGLHLKRITESQGLRRLGAFCDLMGDLGSSNHHRVLSSVPMRRDDEVLALESIAEVVVSHLGRQEPLAAAACAEAMGMSESRFSRHFRRHTGRSFTDFVNRFRIQRASHALQHSDRPIGEIAQASGFRGTATFNRRFQDIHGTTPREYRERAVQSDRDPKAA